MNKSIIPGVITFCVGTISSIVANFVYGNPIVTISVMAATCFAVIAILAHVYSIRKNPCIPCCGLETIGLQKVYPSAKDSIEDTIRIPSKSFRFLGVSAEFVVNSKEFKEVVKKKVSQENCYFEFLLLSPDAKTPIRKHADSEGITEDGLRKRIQAYNSDLQQLASDLQGRIEVRFYEGLPIFRLVIVDDEICYVSYYGTKGRKGVNTPQLVFRKTDYSIYNAFLNYYEKEKSKCKLCSDNISHKPDVN